MGGHFNICYCHTCKKHFQSFGIARHRAMHRDKNEDCKITYSGGDTWVHQFSEREKKSAEYFKNPKPIDIDYPTI